MHSLEANEGRSEETEEEVEGDRYEEGDKIVNFLWVAVRTAVVVEDGPEARLYELVSQQMAPQKTVQGLSHQLMAQKMVQKLIPKRESLLKV